MLEGAICGRPCGDPKPGREESSRTLMAMAYDEKIRAFLAIPLAECFLVEIGPLLKKLEAGYPSFRWVAPHHVHVTLHFFGSIESKQIQIISERIRPIAENTVPLSFFLSEMGAFPGWNRPRVVWAGLQGDTARLKDLRRTVESCLQKEGFECEAREFEPHVTFGRMRQGQRGTKFTPFPFGPTPSRLLTRMILFKSRLTAKGPLYEALEIYPFKAS